MRFALAFDGRWLEAWHLGCVEELLGMGSLVGIVESPSSGEPSAARGSTRLRRHLARRHARRYRVDVSSRFATVPRLAAGKPAGADGPEFVLRLGDAPVAPGAERCAPQGLWHFEHESRADLPFFDEVAAGECVTLARLLVRHPKWDGDRALLEGRIGSDLRSYDGQRRRIEGLLSSWPSYACRRVARLGFEACVGDRPPRPQSGMPAPGDATIALRVVARRIAFAWRRLFRQPQWNIGVLRQSAGEVMREGGCREDRIDWAPIDGREGFLADPFGLARAGGLDILCEFYGYRRGKGWITALRWADGKFRGEAVPALETGHHLSYPGLLEQAGDVYCVPESCAADEIALYRAGAFPHRWERVRSLVDGFGGVDPTLFRGEDRWWLFSTRRGGEADCALWIWHAPELAGPWEAHALNPVKIDVTGARPGGALFVHEGALYRPTQDCSRHYGWRIVIQKVERLTPREFAESPACVVEADPASPYPMGRHTFTPVGDVVLVDGHREAFVRLAFARILRIWARDIRRRLAGR